MAERGAKLAPVAVTVVPTGPWVGFRVNVWVCTTAVTVNVADAVSRGTVPTSLPETVTV
jgi:hypothetical protein